MLWHKAWLETRVRLLFIVGLMLFVSAFTYTGIAQPLPLSMRLQGDWSIVAAVAVLLAGAGIATQPAFQASKGLHGSTLFTLSLPVSRLRLLAVRAGLGWSLVIGFVVVRCTALWFELPAGETKTLSIMLQQAVVLIACSTGIYAIPLLLATVLDEYWRNFASFGIILGLRYLFRGPLLPSSVNLMRAMGEDSPILGHTMPWAAMACSLGLAAVLFFAALKIVQRRKY